MIYGSNVNIWINSENIKKQAKISKHFLEAQTNILKKLIVIELQQIIAW